MINRQKLKFFTLNFASNEVLLKSKGHLRIKLYLCWVLRGFPHFGKTGCKSGESIFCNLGRVAKLVEALQSNWKVPFTKPTGHSTRCRDPTLLCGSYSPSGWKLIAQTQWLISAEWDHFLYNNQNLGME